MIKKYLLYIYRSPRKVAIHLSFFFIFSFLFLESNNETILFKNIDMVAKIQTEGQHDTIFVKRVMEMINKMMKDREDIFIGDEELPYKANIMNSVDATLRYGTGKCGGFSNVFARSLMMAGYPTRIGQMKVDGTFGGHIVIETYLSSLKKWVVMDPLFLLTFTNPQGVWASFDEVSSNWPYYEKQIDAKINYKNNYNYSDIRYTNWNNLPVLGPFVFKVMERIKGKEFARTFSFRPYLLNTYRLYNIEIIILYIFYIIFSFRNFRRSKDLVINH